MKKKNLIRNARRYFNIYIINNKKKCRSLIPLGAKMQKI